MKLAIFNKESKFLTGIHIDSITWSTNPQDALLVNADGITEKEGAKVSHVEDAIWVDPNSIQTLSESDVIELFSIIVTRTDDNKKAISALKEVTGKKWSFKKNILNFNNNPMGHDNVYNYVTSWGLPIVPVVNSINELSKSLYWPSDEVDVFYTLPHPEQDSFGA